MIFAAAQNVMALVRSRGTGQCLHSLQRLCRLIICVELSDCKGRPTFLKMAHSSLKENLTDEWEHTVE